MGQGYPAPAIPFLTSRRAIRAQLGRPLSGRHELRRYDASPDIAEAWLRLRSGTHKPEDLVLLEHELAESNFYRANPGATYEAAHAAADKIANWESQIPSPTYEDFSRPWR